MKKYLFMMAAAIAVMACEKENAVLQQVDPELAGKNVVTFSATLEKADTKAVVAGNNDFTWETTDVAAVYSKKGQKVSLTVSSPGSGNGRAIFTGVMTDDDDEIEAGAIVVYPADRLSWDAVDNKPQVTFPTSYDAPNKTQGPTLAAKVAADRKLAFKYLAGTVKVTLTGLPSNADHVVLNTANDIKCTGTYDLDLEDSNSNDYLIEGTPSGNAVTVSGLASGTNVIYMPLPTIGDQDLYVDIYDSSDNKLFFKGVSLSGSHTVTRNLYLVMNDLAMPAADIYVVGDMTDRWQIKDASAGLSNALKLTNTAGTYSGRLAVRTANSYFRIRVAYNAEYSYEIQPDDETANLSGSFTSAGTTYAVPIAETGVYTITFTPTNPSTGDYTGSYTLTKKTEGTDITPDYYITNSASDWAAPFDYSMKLTALHSSKSTERYMYRGVLPGLSYKIYYNEAWGTAYGLKDSVLSNDLTSANLTASGKAGDVFTIFEVFAIDGTPTTLKGNFAYDEGSDTDLKEASTVKSVTIMGVDLGSGEDWITGFTMAQDATYKRIWSYDITGVTKNTRFAIKVVNSDDSVSWYGYSNRAYLGDGAWDWNVDDNIGIWAGNWKVVFNELTSKIHVYKTN